MSASAEISNCSKLLSEKKDIYTGTRLQRVLLQRAPGYNEQIIIEKMP